MTYQVVIEEDKENNWRYVNVLRAYHQGQMILEEWDRGEPEDNSFWRDYSWVKGALIRAYELGVEDGRG